MIFNIKMKLQKNRITKCFWILMKKKIKGSQNRKKRMNSSINNKKKFTLKFHFQQKMKTKIFFLALILISMIGQIYSCCCCDSKSNLESYQSLSGACSLNCKFRSDLHPPCVSACQNQSFFVDLNRKIFKRKWSTHY